MELTNQDARRASTPLHAPEIPSSADRAHDFTEAKRRVFEKNSAGVAMRTPVRLATARVKCLVLCVSSQSGLLVIAERSSGTSGACRIK